MASRRSQIAPALKGGSARSGISPETASARRHALDAALDAYAGDRSQVPRELRIVDESSTWRIVYRTDPDAVIILEVFRKKTSKTPKRVISNSKFRLQEYDNA